LGVAVPVDVSSSEVPGEMVSIGGLRSKDRYADVEGGNETKSIFRS